MQENKNKGDEEPGKPDLPEGKTVSRRDFLKIAGVAGAAVAASGGLGSLIAACGGGATTTTAGATTTSAAATTTSAGGTTSTGGATTTVSTSAQMGREIKFGFMTPQTGGTAAFGIPDKWASDKWQAFAKSGQLIDAKGIAHPMSVVIRDTQSDLNYGGTVAGQLITVDKVDILMAASTTGTTIPAALQAEALGCPCVLTDSPADSLIKGVGGTSSSQFKWWYFVFWDNQALLNASLALYADKALPTNKVVGCLWANDVEGNDRRAFYTPALKNAGYTVVDGGAFQAGTEDWTAIIQKFKSAGAEILQGLMIPPDWGVFWKQCYQTSYVPKVVDIGIQTLFPETMEAGGDTGYGMCGQSWWHPLNPFKSSLTGETCAQLALDYETTTGHQWTQPIEHYMLFEWAVDVLKRTSNVDDKEEIIKNIASTKMDTIVGPIDFTTPVEQGTTKVGVRSFNNVCTSVLWMGQWVKGVKKYDWDTKIWPYDLLIVEPSDVGGYLKAQAPPIIMPATTFK